MLDGREDWLAEIRNVRETSNTTSLPRSGSFFSVTQLSIDWWLTFSKQVYSLASVIVWFILIASLLDSAYPVWYPYYGSWLVALVVEIVLITLSVVDSMPTTTIDSVDLGLAAARVGLLISLLLFLFGRRITAGRYNQGDEENQPLLAPSHVQGSSEDSGVTQGSTQYGSISTDGSGAGKPDWETRAKERERKARQRVEDRLRDDGNWWTYAKGFSVRHLPTDSVEITLQLKLL